MHDFAFDTLRPSLSRFAAFAVFTLALIAVGNVEAANVNDCEAAKLLPKTVIAFAEFPNLGRTVGTIVDHPMRQSLMEMPAYAAVLESGGFGHVKMVVKAFEGTMKQPWREALHVLSDGGVSVALDASNGGIALLMKTSDKEAFGRFREFMLGLRAMTGQLGKPKDYRGFQTYAFSDDLKMAFVDNWFLLTNDSEAGKAIIDQYVDLGDESLSSNDRFQNALKQRQANEHSAAFAYLDVASVREGGMAKDIFQERIDNFVGELLLGGIFANVRQTPFATVNVEVAKEGVRLALATPHDRAWEPPREYYFGAPKHYAVSPTLNVKDRLFALSAHRDMSQMWLRSGDLLTERASDELAKADTSLTTFFSGRDFGEDILGSLESEIQMVGKPQDFEGRLPQPAIKLPAFAMQFRMKDPETTQPELRRIFQSFMGFLNVIGAMEGRPQFDIDMDSVGEAKLYTASYVPGVDDRESLTAPINFNFSPTLAFVADNVILSSTIPLARELISLHNGPREDTGSRKPEPQINASAIVHAKTLQALLKVNQDHLVANSMLEKGQSEESARGEIELLLELLGFVKDADMSLHVSDRQMQLNLSLTVDATE